MFTNIFKRQAVPTGAIFNGHYVDVKVFYVSEFNRMPCIFFIGELDGGRAASYIDQQFGSDSTAIYQHAWYDHDNSKLVANNTLYVLNTQRIIEVTSDYCQLFFTPAQYTWATQLSEQVAKFKKLEGKQVQVLGFARRPVEQ